MGRSGRDPWAGLLSVVAGVASVGLYLFFLASGPEESNAVVFVLNQDVAVRDGSGQVMGGMANPLREPRRYTFPGPLVLVALVTGVVLAILGLVKRDHARRPAWIGLGLNLGTILLVYGFLLVVAFAD